MKKNIKVSVIQKPPVYLNLKASIERAVSVIDQSAKEGSKLVVCAGKFGSNLTVRLSNDGPYTIMIDSAVD